MLSFIGNGYGYPTNYKLFWDAARNWFGYQDVTIHPVAEPEPSGEDESYTEEPSVEETSTASEYVTTGELYYEEETVVGS